MNRLNENYDVRLKQEEEKKELIIYSYENRNGYNVRYSYVMHSS